MKWTDVKKEINSISDEEKKLIELTALLASYRKNHNITQAELANQINLTQAQIARVETFSQPPTLQTINKIASGLGLELALVDKNTKKLVNN